LNEICSAFLLTTLAGLSTGIGSAIAYGIRRPKLTYLSVLLGFSAGVMIYISFVELLGAAIEEVGFLNANLAFFCGIITIFLVDRLIPHIHVDVQKDTQRGSLEYAGMMTAVGIAIHNFPEGLAVLAVALASPEFGIPIALAIAIHNIPEGISVSVPIFYATGNRRKAFLYSFLSGISEPVGALVGYLILLPFITPMLLASTLAFVGGIMVFICFDELIPVANKYGEQHLCMYGLFLGMFIMMVSLMEL
jgi:ZIP family zinc transporter